METGSKGGVIVFCFKPFQGDGLKKSKRKRDGGEHLELFFFVVVRVELLFLSNAGVVPDDDGDVNLPNIWCFLRLMLFFLQLNMIIVRSPRKGRQSKRCSHPS